MTPRWLRPVRWPPVAFRLLALAGLAVSSALVADHVFGVGAFCGATDPCADVTASPYGKVLGFPLAGLGLAGFALVLLTTLVPRRWALGLARVLAGTAGLAGVTLLVIQFAVLHQVCPYCVVADLSAAGLAFVALFWRPPAEQLAGLWQWVGVFGWLWAGLAAGLGPIFWEAAHLPATAPEQVKAHWAPGQITMVEVTDFDCPACQRADPTVREWVAAHPTVRFVRLVSPLPGHLDAWPAALAYLAAARQGKAEEMAIALYTAPSRDRAVCRLLAAGLGLNLSAYDQAINSPEAENEIRATTRWVATYNLGQPFFWIQDELVVGVASTEKLDAALARATPAP
jgi:hypothetical protein